MSTCTVSLMQELPVAEVTLVIWALPRMPVPVGVGAVVLSDGLGFVGLGGGVGMVGLADLGVGDDVAGPGPITCAMIPPATAASTNPSAPMMATRTARSC